MGIMTRILRLWKADVHGVMDQMEDKDLLVKQYLREMENNLQKKESRLHQLADSTRQVDKNLSGRRLEIDKIEKDLALALRKENDEIARALIRKQRIQEKHCERLQQQSEALSEEQKHLSQLLDKQRLQYETLKAKAAGFCRRAEQTPFAEANTIFNESFAFTIDEDEIEIELMRRKESMQKEGGET